MWFGTSSDASEFSYAPDSSDTKIDDDEYCNWIFLKYEIVSINAQGWRALQLNNADLPKYAVTANAGSTLQLTTQVELDDFQNFNGDDLIS